MAAYLIGRVQMRDPSWVEEYGAKIQPLLKKYGGRYLARAGKMETPKVASLLEHSYSECVILGCDPVKNVPDGVYGWILRSSSCSCASSNDVR